MSIYPHGNGLTNTWIEKIGYKIFNNEKYALKVMKLNRDFPPIFWGVYPCDTLEQLPLLQNGTLIVNLSPSYTQGSHFVCIHCKNNTCIYFDPLGMSVGISSDVEKFLLRRYPLGIETVLSQEMKMQAENSYRCGLFCLAFICSRMFTKYSLKCIFITFLYWEK